MDWQPIKTAPKDGTKIILWLGSLYQEMVLAKFYEDWDNWIPADDEPDESTEIYGFGKNIPTHWMQLLEGPINLLNCPFCGGNPKDLHFSIECDKCKLSMVDGDYNYNELVDRWNSRK